MIMGESQFLIGMVIPILWKEGDNEYYLVSIPHRYGHTTDFTAVIALL